MMTQATTYFKWSKTRCLLTGYYHDPAADKELERRFYISNITLSRSINGGRKERMS